MNKESILVHWQEARESVLTFIGVVWLSLWAGTASFLDANKEKPFEWKKYFAHVISASFAGVMTYFLCQASNVTGPMMGAACGLAAHMGTPALLKLKLFRNLLGK